MKNVDAYHVEIAPAPRRVTAAVTKAMCEQIAEIARLEGVSVQTVVFALLAHGLGRRIADWRRPEDQDQQKT